MKMAEVLIAKDDGVNFLNKRMADIIEEVEGKNLKCVLSGLFDTNV